MDTNQLLSEFQFFDKYSRFSYEKGRRETWAEAVQRSVDYLIELSEGKLDKLDYDKIKEYMLDKKAFPSMRLFAMAGDAARRDNSTIYNCSYVAIDSIDSIAEILYLSMSGTGCGFSVENRYVSMLPVVGQYVATGLANRTIVIEDTQVGWASAFRSGIETWMSGGDIDFDFSKIRPAGSVLKTKGGRASGGEVLKSLFSFSREIILSAAGRKLKPIEVYDIVTAIGDCARSGGARRSALLCLFDKDDKEMLHAKDFGWWENRPARANANNSAVIENRLSREEVAEIMTTMDDGGSGEPAFFMRVNANSFSPRRDGDYEFGTNPCFAKDTYIHTKDGHFQIKDLVGKTVSVWDGNQWVSIDNFRITATNQKMIDVKLGNGRVLRVTPYHKLVTSDGKVMEAKNLSVGDELMPSAAPQIKGSIRANGAYAKGFLLGDGWAEKDKRVRVYIFKNKFSCIDRFIKSASEIEPEHGFRGQSNVTTGSEVTKRGGGESYVSILGLSSRRYELFDFLLDKTRLPKYIFNWDNDSKYEFVAGLFDADGTFPKKQKNYSIKNTSENLLLDLQLLLQTIGIKSRVKKIHNGGMRSFHNGDYIERAAYKLTINKNESVRLSSVINFSRLNANFACREINRKTDDNVIVALDYNGIDDVVYCCTVPTTHQLALSVGVMSGQCGEIHLRSMQFCNLSQAIARESDTQDTIKEKIKIAAIIGTIQATATNFPFIRKEWKENTEEERLLGVDITGMSDVPHLFTEDFLSELKSIAIETNRIYAEKLGIPQSVAVTCNKPSGNSSVLFACSPGIHSRWSDYYIRRVRVDAKSPIKAVFEYSGFKLVPDGQGDNNSSSTFVAEYPVKSPDGAITNGTRSALDQLNWWKMIKVNWTEHNPSCTITYKKHELPAMIDWIYENQEIVGGISFLPYDDHVYDLAPYEKITKEQYEEMVKDIPQIDWESLLPYFESEDNTTIAQELACMSGTCEI